MGRMKDLDLALQEAFPEWYTHFEVWEDHLIICGTKYEACGCCASPLRFTVFTADSTVDDLANAVIEKVKGML